MIHEDEKVRERLLVQLRKHFAIRRSPRATMSAILMATGIAGFVTSIAMLKFGIVQMGVRYPLAVLFAWGIFVALVRAWAARESAHFRMEEHLGDPMHGERIPARGKITHERRSKRRGGDDSIWGWVDWLNLTDLFDAEAAGCIAGVAVMILITLVAGAILTVAGLIGGAEVVFAELFLDAVLITALSKRLRKLKPRWWVAGVLRQTMWPVLLTAFSLTAGGIILQKIAPEAKSIGGVWRHYHPAPEPSVPQLERER